jgi:type IV secretory pathway VirB10-like protein
MLAAGSFAMVSKPVTLAFVAVGCMAAAGVGAYVAVRQSSNVVATRRAAVAMSTPAAAPVAVAETEATVDDPAARPAARPAPDEKAAPVAEPRREAVAESRPAPGVSARGAARGPGPAAAPVPPAQAPAPIPAPPELSVAPGAPVDLGEPVSVPAYEPPAPVYEDLVVSANSVLGLRLETSVSSETAAVEDPVEARVTRDVTVGGMLAVPAGSHVLGTVVLVDRGGKMKERARLGVRFHTLVLADHSQVPIQTDAIYREGESPANQSVAKIGGAAVGGAILGALFGGAKGAVMGGATGAAGGTALVMAGDRNPATLPAGSTVTVRLISPVTITVER